MRNFERKKLAWDYKIKSTGNDASWTQINPSNWRLGF